MSPNIVKGTQSRLNPDTFDPYFIIGAKILSLHETRVPRFEFLEYCGLGTSGPMRDNGLVFSAVLVCGTMLLCVINSNSF